MKNDKFKIGDEVRTTDEYEDLFEEIVSGKIIDKKLTNRGHYACGLKRPGNDILNVNGKWIGAGWVIKKR